MSNLSDFGGSGGNKIWTSGVTYKQGQVVLSPADNYQQYVRITAAGSGATDPKTDTTNYRPFGGRAIKSIQRGVTGLLTGTTTVTISSVDTAKTILWGAPGLGAQAGTAVMPGITLTNSTTITINFSGGAISGNNFTSWQVVEYY